MVTTSRTASSKKTAVKAEGETAAKKATVKKTASGAAPAKPKAAAKKVSAAKAEQPAKPAKAATSAKSPPAKNAKKTATSPEERYHMIATAAYFLAERRGFSGGYEMIDWITAEAEIDKKLRS